LGISARVDASIAPDVPVIVRGAADPQGRSVSDFLVAAALKDARRMIEDRGSRIEDRGSSR